MSVDFRIGTSEPVPREEISRRIQCSSQKQPIPASRGHKFENLIPEISIYVLLSFIILVFGHNAAPRARIWTKIGGRFLRASRSFLNPPGSSKPQENQNLETTNSQNKETNVRNLLFCLAADGLAQESGGMALERIRCAGRGGNSGFWRLTFEKTVWGDKGGNFEEKTFRKTKENPQKNKKKSEKQ